MKSVHMEFIEDKRWRLLWSVAVICFLVFLGGVVLRGKRMNQSIQIENDSLNAVQLRLQQIRTPVPNKVDPRYGSLIKAAGVLQQDPNKAFATPEAVQEPGVRLRSLSLESASNTLRLEYELDSMLKVSAITELLNNGYEQRPWQLEVVSAAVGTTSLSAPSMVPIASMYRGVWSVQLNKL